MEIRDYLARINYHGRLDPSANTLRRLQLAHLFTVPFENLSIHAGEPIVLDDEALFAKVVGRRRGGFCYELNGLFAALLRELQFPVSLLSAGVAKAEGGFGPEFDHMTLLVELDGRWLADVGFGDSFREPLRVDDRTEQVQDGRVYRIEPDGDRLVVLQRESGGEAGGKDGSDWKPRYRFGLTPRAYPDYAGMCRHHETSPESPFTQSRICSRATPDGRVTLSGMRLITTHNGERQEREVRDESEHAALLAERFGITMLTGSPSGAAP